MKKTILAFLLGIMMVFTFTASGGEEASDVDTSPITGDEIDELYTSPNNFIGRT